MEELLIECFRKNPYLYNRNHKDFRDFKKRNGKLIELAKTLRVPVRKIKDRWRTLRDTYQKEKKRLSYVDDPAHARKWKWMDYMSFLDEAQQYSEIDDTTEMYETDRKPRFSQVILSKTNKEYFDESCQEYDNTKSSWNEERFSYDDKEPNSDNNTSINDNEEYTKSNVKIMKTDSMSSLLVPIEEQTRIKYTKNKSIAGEETVVISKKDGSNIVENIVSWEEPASSSPLPKKSSIQLFCDSLAAQIEDANLTSYQISELQIEFLKKLQEYLPTDK